MDSLTHEELEYIASLDEKELFHYTCDLLRKLKGYKSNSPIKPHFNHDSLLFEESFGYTREVEMNIIIRLEELVSKGLKKSETFEKLMEGVENPREALYITYLIGKIQGVSKGMGLYKKLLGGEK